MSRLPDRRSPCRIDKAKGNRRHPCSVHHADLVDGFRLAQEAQQLRAEAATHGYETELAAYFGDDGTGDAVERRLTFREWLEGSANPARHEQEEADTSRAAASAFQVLDCLGQQFRIVSEQADASITSVAEQTADDARVVAMVDAEIEASSVRLSTDQGNRCAICGVLFMP